MTREQTVCLPGPPSSMASSTPPESSRGDHRDMEPHPPFSPIAYGPLHWLGPKGRGRKDRHIAVHRHMDIAAEACSMRIGQLVSLSR